MPPYQGQPAPDPIAGMYPRLAHPSLQYLFVAEFEDGEQIAQTAEDQSMTDPSKSAFYDVLQKSKEVAVTRFHLTNGHIWYTVDLRDGSFEANGLSFEAFDPYNNPYIRLNGPLRLIYFPNTDLVKVIDQNSLDKVTDFRHSMVRYFIGWQFTDKNGKNYQQTIAIR
jgi:hypothetical protein